MTTQIRTRIAPSPTGYPHIGTIFQALFDYVYAKQNQGSFIIRIEDTDRARYVSDAEDAIYSSLEWCGLVPDEGPKYGGNFGPYRQSERLEIYTQKAQELIEKGDAYYCFCSSERLDQVRIKRQAQNLPPMYDQHCRDIDPAEAKIRAKNEPHVIRMKVPKGEKIEVLDLVRGKIVFESDTVDDQVLIKSDGYPTYHLAVVVDDHLMEITLMVRGEEWITSCPKHVLLYRAFGWEPPIMIHTPLLRNPDKSKLSKRHGHSAVSWYIDQGYLPEAVINFLATRVWNHPDGKEIFGIEELIKHFKFEDMHIQGPIADVAKLDWINGQWIRSLKDEELIEKLIPFCEKEVDKSLLTSIIPLVKERLVTLSQITELTQFFYKTPTVDTKTVLKQAKMEQSELNSYFTKVIDTLQSIEDWQVENIETSLRALQASLEIKPRPAFMSIRLALTGSEATPPLFDVMHVLGKESCIKRLQNTLH